MNEILIEDYGELLKRIDKLPLLVGFDTETTGRSFDSQLLGFSFSDGVKNCYYWDIEKNGLPKKALNKLLIEHELVMHNGLFDLIRLYKYGFKKVNLAADTIILIHELDSELKFEDLKLKKAVSDILGKDIVFYNDVAKKDIIKKEDVKNWRKFVEFFERISLFDEQGVWLHKHFKNLFKGKNIDDNVILKRVNAKLVSPDFYDEKIFKKIIGDDEYLNRVADRHLEKVDSTTREANIRLNQYVLFKIIGEDIIKDGYYERFWRYGACDAFYTMLVWNEYKVKFPKDDSGLIRSLYLEDVYLSKILAEMALHGFEFDSEFILNKRELIVKEVESMLSAVYEEAGEEFNVNSPKQILAVFDKRGVKLTSTAFDVLSKLDDSLSGLITKYRKHKKILSTYIDGYLNAVSDDGKMRTMFNLVGTPTFRLSSNGYYKYKKKGGEGINIQNVPEGMRCCITSDKGKYFLSGDYSGQELRILISLLDNEDLKAKVNMGYDIHCLTASIMYDIPYETIKAEVDKYNEGLPYDKSIVLLRINAKGIGFGILYGMGLLALAYTLGIEFTVEDLRKALDSGELFVERNDVVRKVWNKEERIFAEYRDKKGNYFKDATEWIEDKMRKAASVPRRMFFDKIIGAKRFISNMKSNFNKLGYTQDIYGRRRYIRRDGFEDTKIVNSVIQGSAASIVRKMMIKSYDLLAKSKYAGRIVLRIQVHDELIFEIDDDIPHMEAVAFLRDILEVEILGIKYFTDWAYGTVWGEFKGIKIQRDSSMDMQVMSAVDYDELDYPAVFISLTKLDEVMIGKLNSFVSKDGVGFYMLYENEIYEIGKISEDKISEFKLFVYKEDYIKMKEVLNCDEINC